MNNNKKVREKYYRCEERNLQGKNNFRGKR